MGQCFEYGHGVDKDETQAQQFYRQAHENDYPPGTCALGLCYEIGMGVEEDKARAQVAGL